MDVGKSREAVDQRGLHLKVFLLGEMPPLYNVNHLKVGVVNFADDLHLVRVGVVVMGFLVHAVIVVEYSYDVLEDAVATSLSDVESLTVSRVD